MNCAKFENATRFMRSSVTRRSPSRSVVSSIASCSMPIASAAGHLPEYSRVFLAVLAPRQRGVGSSGLSRPVHDDSRRRTACCSWLASARPVRRAGSAGPAPPWPRLRPALPARPVARALRPALDRRRFGGGSGGSGSTGCRLRRRRGRSALPLDGSVRRRFRLGRRAPAVRSRLVPGTAARSFDGARARPGLERRHELGHDQRRFACSAAACRACLPPPTAQRARNGRQRTRLPRGVAAEVAAAAPASTSVAEPGEHGAQCRAVGRRLATGCHGPKGRRSQFRRAALANAEARPQASSAVSTPSDKSLHQAAQHRPAFRERRVNELDRRALTLRTLLTSGFSPRRRDGRRAGEHELPVDFHEPYLLVLAVVMLLLSVADAFLTVTLLSDGARGNEPAARVRARRAPALFCRHQDGVDGNGRRVAGRNGADQAIQSSSVRRCSFKDSSSPTSRSSRTKPGSSARGSDAAIRGQLPRLSARAGRRRRREPASTRRSSWRGRSRRRRTCAGAQQCSDALHPAFGAVRDALDRR